MPCSSAGLFLGKEGRIQLFTGLASSSQIVGSLFRNTWPAKRAKKLAKGSFSEFSPMEKYTQLLLIERMWQSKKN